jgi:hypothetical protein
MKPLTGRLSLKVERRKIDTPRRRTVRVTQVRTHLDRAAVRCSTCDKLKSFSADITKAEFASARRKHRG